MEDIQHLVLFLVAIWLFITQSRRPLFLEEVVPSIIYKHSQLVSFALTALHSTVYLCQVEIIRCTHHCKHHDIVLRIIPLKLGQRRRSH